MNEVRQAAIGAAPVLSLLLCGMAAPQSGYPQANLAPPADHAAAAASHPPAIAAGTPADVWIDNYRFRSGETLRRLKLHFATLGTPHRDARGDVDNAVLVLHWTGAESRTLLSPTYVHALFDPGRPLDARRYYLVFPDNVGHGESSKPSDGLATAFPNYDYGDIVDLQHKLVTETLGIKHLHAILGMSMGGMNAWQWAEDYPDMVDGVMPVVSLPIPVSGRNLLWRRMVIDDIRTDPDWKKGLYVQPPRGWIAGYKVLRMMIDSSPSLQRQLPDQAAADRYLDAIAAQGERIDANDILYSLKSSFSYDPRPGLVKITTKVFALNFSDDEFNPDRLQVLERVVPTLKQGRYVVQEGTPTSPGHFTMSRPDLWSQHVADFMAWIDAGAARRGL